MRSHWGSAGINLCHIWGIRIVRLGSGIRVLGYIDITDITRSDLGILYEKLSRAC